MKELKEVEELAKKEGLELYKISAATREGVQELIDYVSEVLKTLPKEELIEIEDRKVYTLEEKDNDWTIKDRRWCIYCIRKSSSKINGKSEYRR